MVYIKMDLEQEILADKANEIAKEIDWHIIADCLIDLGWTSVKLNRFHNSEEAVDIENWIEENCTGKWKNLSTHYIFKKKQDAEWFILRWS